MTDIVLLGLRHDVIEVLARRASSSERSLEDEIKATLAAAVGSSTLGSEWIAWAKDFDAEIHLPTRSVARRLSFD